MRCSCSSCLSAHMREGIPLRVLTKPACPSCGKSDCDGAVHHANDCRYKRKSMTYWWAALHAPLVYYLVYLGGRIFVGAEVLVLNNFFFICALVPLYCIFSRKFFVRFLIYIANRLTSHFTFTARLADLDAATSARWKNAISLFLVALYFITAHATEHYITNLTFSSFGYERCREMDVHRMRYTGWYWVDDPAACVAS